VSDSTVLARVIVAWVIGAAVAGVAFWWAL